LFGDLSAAANDSFGALPAQLPLMSDGSGRIWMSEAGARVESQGGSGDQVVVASTADRSLWVYDSSADTARHWVITGTAPEATPSPSPPASMMTPETIAQALQRLAPYARVDVAGQAVVAGREAYLLRFTPTATDTALGSVQAAIDGKTFVPLRLEVFAAAGGPAVLRFGFDSVSYDPVDPALFAFTPPAGSTVTTKTIDGDALRARAEKTQSGETVEPTAAQKDAHEQLARRALLSREQVQSLVPYTLASARDDAARPFRWGYVFDGGLPLTALGEPVFGAAGLGDAGGAGVAPSDANQPPRMGPASVLLYGDGFGAIALAQTRTTADIDKQLKQLPVLVEKTTVNGTPAQLLATPLGGVVVWQQGDTTLVAGGMVPRADLLAFAATVR
jgi:outer membrane lipoprotein-sorting protein